MDGFNNSISSRSAAFITLKSTTLSPPRRSARALSEKGILLVAKRKDTKKGSLTASVVAACCVSFAVVGFAGFGIASAGIGSADNIAFGLGRTSNAIIVPKEVVVEPEAEVVEDVNAIEERPLIHQTAQRDITRGIEEIAAEEEAARIAAEQEAIARANAARDNQIARNGSLPIEPVDFSVGRDAFIAEWTKRIDDYLAGSPLAGYGEVFATAAWENGVDPRWSPAISNTESSKGRNCFKYHNAWGWGQSSWPSWEAAINAHVAGLADGYGYTISVANANKYCPPTYLDWYEKTLSQMRLI